jgi:hypothetical protein
MRKFDLSQLQTREALAGLLLALCLFAAAVLQVRLPAARSLSAAWMFAVSFLLGGLSIIGTHLLLGSGRLPIAVRLVISLFSAGTASAGILATASAGSAATFAGGCVFSLLILGGSVVLATCEVDSAATESQTQADAKPIVALPIAVVAPPVPDVDQHTALSVEHSPAPNLDQSWRRWHEDNRDFLEGCVRVAFEAGQATAIVHIPVQPAMAAPPQVECEPVDDSPIRISADPVLPFGIRLVCRRSESMREPFETMVSVLISSPLAAARAA